MVPVQAKFFEKNLRFFLAPHAGYLIRIVETGTVQLYMRCTTGIQLLQL
eukprot:SAG11_NODE_36868_length_259_cov_1.168750_1_plen_49_part_00